ncbi:hypothetical protein [Actinacidiphila sp. ITFR-21]|uniref:hypothetical protein n=1 Tax=Actinacidiphila sp. ITFR-21 TaxID=3075199 RepID=UPI002889EE0F|nr:hypothetical protein [Streptomyces sp. ITFR-21]WNI18730.1 hypothetical protein RLT57_26530 [Streptomyces sp. ITFR-21]
MPSVVGLLEQHELAARRRVGRLREEADRIQAELAAAELEWQEWTIARRRVDTVLAPGSAETISTKTTPDPPGEHVPAVPADAVKPGSQVPVWREGLGWSVLSVDYQRIVQLLADRVRLHQGPLTCQEMAASFGMDAVPARVEGLRAKAKRLVARGWLAEPGPGRFTPAAGVSGPGGGS